MTPPDTPSRTLSPLEWLAAFACAAVALIVLRPATLATPYWWDAGAVYVPGAQWLVDHGFNAAPGVFPSDLGRGHTPGFYLVLAAVFRVFGTTPTSGHALVFGTSCAALVLTYALGTWWIGRIRATFAVALLACSPLFLSMSSEALPEIPMTALTLAALYAFARGWFARSALVCGALVLCKEVGVACPLALAGAAGVAAWRAETDARRRWLVAGAWQAIPLVVLAGFFAWQRVREGWFVLPYHAGLFHEHHDLAHQLRRVLGSPTMDDGRWIAVATALAFFAWQRGRYDRTHQDAPLATAMALLVAANTVFFAKMFFLERYILPIHPVVALVLARPLVVSTVRTRGIAAAGIALACAAGVRARYDGVGFDSGETTFRYLHAVHVHQRLLSVIPPTATVLTTWPMTDELRHPYLGYVRHPVRALSLDYVEMTHVTDPIDAIVVFDTIGSAPRLREAARARGFQVVRREAEGAATIEWWGP